MHKVYLAIPLAPDELLGHINDAGIVFRSKVGLDDRLGEANLATGRVYADRFGPDKEVARVDVRNGKVYLSRLGLDEYVGNVDVHGHMHKHVRLGPDKYIGKIVPFVSYAHSAAAMVLLVLPALEERAKSDQVEDETDDAP